MFKCHAEVVNKPLYGCAQSVLRYPSCIKTSSKFGKDWLAGRSGKTLGRRRQVANVAAGHAEECEDGGLIGGDTVDACT